MMRALKWKIAACLDRLPRVCWATLAMWAMGYNRWSEIDWDCRDADRSEMPCCWCGKLWHSNPDQLPVDRQLMYEQMQNRSEDDQTHG